MWRQRRRNIRTEVTPQGTTLYFDSFGAHAEFNPGSGQWNEYLKVGNVMVGVRFLALATETVTLRYFHTDHLGSIAVITDGNGAVSERLSYDAWGKRRFANGADDPSGSIVSATTRGFTGQEELSVTGLVHLNGRVYDSLIGRMMSADPTVPDALNPQAWNRYTYVGNDPLTFTDPTGYSWLSSFFSSIGNFFKSIFSNSIVRAIVQIALAVILTPVFNGVIFLAAAASAAIVTGLAGGKLGQVLKAAVIAGAQALAFDAVAGVTGHNPAFGTLEYFENVAGHAAVGCVSAVASGGKCGPGALSAAVPAAAAPLVADVTQNAPDKFTRTIEGSAASGVLGGLASVAGGGKFADGAVTGAFGYLFNAAPHGEGGDSTDEERRFLNQEKAALGEQPSGASNDPLNFPGALLQSFFRSLSSTLRPGPYAGESIPARGPGRDFTSEERSQINDIGNATGCHTCGSTDPGTQSGNFVADHQPPSALNPPGNPQRLYPQCLSCSRTQGGEVRGAGGGF